MLQDPIGDYVPLQLISNPVQSDPKKVVTTPKPHVPGEYYRKFFIIIYFNFYLFILNFKVEQEEDGNHLVKMMMKMLPWRSLPRKLMMIRQETPRKAWLSRNFVVKN